MAIFFIRKILSRCRPFDFHKCQEFQFREISELAEHSSRLSMKERLSEYPELPVDREMFSYRMPYHRGNDESPVEKLFVTFSI